MAKLSILGAQRVKALIEVLEDQLRKEIRELESQKMSREEAQAIVDREFGVKGVREELEGIKERVEALSKELRQKTGYYASVNIDYEYRNRERRKYDNRVAEVRDGDIPEKIEAVKENYKDKERSLWLCETLEEAKAIVGIE